MTPIRAKFCCNGVEKVQNWNYPSVPNAPQFLFNAKFRAVTSGSDENKKFFASTPNGELSVQSVGDFFTPGREYYIDITACEEA